MPGCKRAGDCIGWFNEGAARTRKGVEGIADRVPAYAQMSHHSAGLLGESTNKFFSDAGAFLRCELTADVFYRIDGPTIHYDVYNIESEVLGARLIWSEGQIPTVDSRNPLLNSVDAFQRLHPIKTGMAGRMPYVMEINKWLVDMGLSPKIRFTGPFTRFRRFILRSFSVGGKPRPWPWMNAQ